jgi:hypothetical protein
MLLPPPLAQPNGVSVVFVTPGTVPATAVIVNGVAVSADGKLYVSLT